MSPYLVLGALTSTVQDPQLYCLERQLQQLRRACRHDEETAASIVNLASTASPSRLVHGPATALARSLQGLGLSLGVDGCIKGPDNDRILLMSCTSRDIRRLLQSALSQHVAKQVSHRNGLSNCPPPYPALTGRLLQRLTGNEQLVIACHVAGAFASQAAIATWADDSDGTCPLCGGKQTKAHKFLECPALASVRDRWSTYLDCAVDWWPHWLHGPFATQPPDLEMPRLVFHTRRLVAPRVPSPIREGYQRKRCARLFTDGSCLHPTCPIASRAAFAVVLDCSGDDAEVPTLLQSVRQQRSLPEQLLVVHQGLVPGVQNINRAEFCAIVQAAEVAGQLQVAEAEIWSDSKVAIDQWHLAEAGMDGLWPELCEHVNWDELPRVTVRKLAAHQDLDLLVGLDQWRAAGNTLADIAAKQALAREFAGVSDACQAAAQDVEEQSDLLWLFWRYLLEVSKEEARQLKLPLQWNEDEVVDVRSSPAASTAAWHQLTAGPAATWNVPAPERAWLLACSWPPWLCLPIWNWARSLRWCSAPAKGRAVVGAAYIELFVNFVVVTGILPAETLQAACKLDEAPRHFPVPMVLRQLVHGFVEALRQLERLSRCQLLPQRRSKVFALRALGWNEPKIGVGVRPEFDKAEETVQLVCQVLQQSSCAPLIRFVQAASRDESQSGQIQRAWRLLRQRERTLLARSLRRR